MEISQLIRDYLYNPNDGYYKTKNPIGKNNDFITAPEISQTFGEITAGYILNYFEQFKCPIDFVEIGAGKGTWLSDILQTIERLSSKNISIASDFLKMANLRIIETNSKLIDLQKNKLDQFQISWHEDFDQFAKQNKDRPLFIISNELFDCLPIDQYIKTFDGWQEITAEKINNELYFKPHKISQSKSHIIKILEDNYDQYEVDSIIEIGESAKELFGKIVHRINSNDGLAITIDYGYLEPPGRSTLQAVKDHQKIPIKDIYHYLEKCDLTSHVDFGQIDIIAKSQDIQSTTYCQRDFLIEGGIEQRRDILIAKNPAQKKEIESSINRLIDKDQMGELFKVHIAAKNSNQQF